MPTTVRRAASTTVRRSAHPVRRSLGLLALSLGLVALAGCSRDPVSGNADAGSVAPEIADQSGRNGGAGDEPVAGGGAPEDAPAGGPALTQQIVRTGDISVDVDDIAAAANRITALVSAANGSVGSDQREGEAADGSADLVVRIPPERFDSLLEDIAELGDELSRSVAAEDVSTVVADVDARVRSLQNSIDPLQALAAQAVSVGDLITIESELYARQAELESLQAQQRALSDQVSLATLSIRLTASGDPDTDDAGFLASLSAGWNGLLDAGKGLLSVVGLLLPWLVLVALIAGPLWLLLGRRHAPGAPSAPEPSGPAANAPARLPG